MLNELKTYYYHDIAPKSIQEEASVHLP